METNKEGLKFATGGDATLLVWSPPQGFLRQVVSPACFLLPIMQRAGGFLAAVPLDFLSDELLLDSAADGYEGVLGPSKSFEALLMEEDDQGNVVTTDYVNSFLVVDMLDAALREMHEFNSGSDDADAIVPFESTMPSAIPKVSEAVPQILEWVDSAVTPFLQCSRGAGSGAYPKKADTQESHKCSLLVEQVNALALQVQMLTELQKQSMQGKASSFCCKSCSRSFSWWSDDFSTSWSCKWPQHLSDSREGSSDVRSSSKRPELQRRRLV